MNSWPPWRNQDLPAWPGGDVSYDPGSGRVGTGLRSSPAPARGVAAACLLVILLLCLGSARVVDAQSATGTILGRVSAPDGSAAAGATVGLIDRATGATWRVRAETDGHYELPLLPPGEYELRVASEGFRTVVRRSVRLQVNQRARIDFELEVGPVSEEVTVVADAPLLDLSSAAIGTVVDGEEIIELPLNGRDFFQLATLVAGAFLPAEGSQNSTQGGAVAINGAREQSNNFLLDGVDNNDLAINQIAVPPSIESVQEFEIVSSTYSAEFGRSAGGQFTYVTKSGTNDWRGSLFEFHRDDSLDARNYFDDPGLPQPEFRRDQFGGTIGGPVVRDELFVFAGYEGTSIEKGFTRVATVPPLGWREGDFSSLLTGVADSDGFDTGQLFDPRTGQPFAGNVIPAELIDPAGRALLDFYPAPDRAGALGPSAATVSPIGDSRVHQFNLRIDRHAGGADRQFLRYSLWSEDRFNPFDPLLDPTNVPGFGTFTENVGHNVAAGWTRALGDDAYLDLRVGYNRLRAGIFQENRGNDVSSALGIDGLPEGADQVGRPGIVLGITDALIEPTNTPQERRSRTLHLAGSYTRLSGDHGFKVGFDFRHFALDSFLDVVARGQFVFVGISGNPVADLLLGFPAVAIRQNPAVDTDNGFRTFAVSGYLQDDWRVSNRLTLNLGLRYDFNRPPVEVEDRLSVPQLEDPNGTYLRVGRNGIPRAGYRADTNNLAPRLGFAWLLDRNGETVLRGGWGTYYDVGILNSSIGPRLNPPFFSLDLFPGPGSLRDAFAGQGASIPLVLGVSQDYRDPSYQQFSLGVQRRLDDDWAVELAYVGSRGRNLIRQVDLNQGPPGGPPVRNPAFGPAEIVVSSARSRYDSLQLRVERRFRNGLSLLGAYTWSRSRDNASALFGSAATGSTTVPQNSFDLDAEWGPSDFDTPHRLVVSGMWDLPFGPGTGRLETGVLGALLGGWQLAGIVTLQSGRPFTVYYGPSVNYSGTSNGANGGSGLDRPNQIGDPDLSDRGGNRWFDPDAFAPAVGAFGDVGRNSLRGDGIDNVDFALYRNLELGDAGRLQLRIEAFNLLNEPHFFLPVADLASAAAGRVVRAADGRQVQLGVRFIF